MMNIPWKGKMVKGVRYFPYPTEAYTLRDSLMARYPYAAVSSFPGERLGLGRGTVFGVRYTPNKPYYYPQLEKRRNSAARMTSIPRGNPMHAWNIYVDGEVLDTLFFDKSMGADEVKRAVLRDGYPENSVVKRAMGRPRKSLAKQMLEAGWLDTPKKRNSAVRLPGAFGVGAQPGGPLHEAGNPRGVPQSRWKCQYCGASGWWTPSTHIGPRPDANHDRPQGGRCMKAYNAWYGNQSNPRTAIAARRAAGNPPREPDMVAATELDLYVTNDADLYRQQHQPILKNLITKMARGTYDRDKAVKLFMYLAENGAKKYAREFGDGREWNVIFTVPTRRAAATMWRDYFETEAKLGNYDNFLPKKYQNRGRPANQQNPKKRASKKWWRFNLYSGDKVTGHAIGQGTKREAKAKAESGFFSNTRISRVVMSGPYKSKEAASFTITK